MDGDKPYYQADLRGPLLVVVGGEGRGLGRLAKEACDFVVRIPMRGKISSLNASVACSLLLYEVYRQRET
jgi:23S rRNA (guanosine2251-2'-O)-methyltransferase